MLVEFWLFTRTIDRPSLLTMCFRSDVLAHRQLSAAIGYTPLHASLHSKPHVERVLDVVNRRHRMAQMAGRASVEFYVGLALKGRNEREKGKVREEAFVIRTFRNGLGVFVSKYVFPLRSSNVMPLLMVFSTLPALQTWD